MRRVWDWMIASTSVCFRRLSPNYICLLSGQPWSNCWFSFALISDWYWVLFFVSLPFCDYLCFIVMFNWWARTHIWTSARQNLLEDLCDQRRLSSACTSAQPDHNFYWSYGLQPIQRRINESLCRTGVDVQADLSLCWLYRSYCRFYRALALFCSLAASKLRMRLRLNFFF